MKNKILIRAISLVSAFCFLAGQSAGFAACLPYQESSAALAPKTEIEETAIVFMVRQAQAILDKAIREKPDCTAAELREAVFSGLKQAGFHIEDCAVVSCDRPFRFFGVKFVIPGAVYYLGFDPAKNRAIQIFDLTGAEYFQIAQTGEPADGFERRPLVKLHPYLPADDIEAQVTNVALRGIVEILRRGEMNARAAVSGWLNRFGIVLSGLVEDDARLVSVITRAREYIMSHAFIPAPHLGAGAYRIFREEKPVGYMEGKMFIRVRGMALTAQVNERLERKGRLTREGTVELNPNLHASSADLLATWAHELKHVQWFEWLVRDPYEARAAAEITTGLPSWREIDLFYRAAIADPELLREWDAASPQRKVNEIIAVVAWYDLLDRFSRGNLTAEEKDELQELEKLTGLTTPGTDIPNIVRQRMQAVKPVVVAVAESNYWQELLQKLNAVRFRAIREMDASYADSTIHICDRMAYRDWVAKQAAKDETLSDEDLDKLAKDVEEKVAEMGDLLDELSGDISDAAGESDAISSDLGGDEAKHDIREITINAVIRYVQSGKKDFNVEQLIALIAGGVKEKGLISPDEVSALSEILYNSNIQKLLEKAFYTASVLAKEREVAAVETQDAQKEARREEQAHNVVHRIEHLFKLAGHRHHVILLPILFGFLWALFSGALDTTLYALTHPAQSSALPFLPLFAGVLGGGAGVPGPAQPSPEEIVAKYTVDLGKLAAEGQFDDSYFLEDETAKLDHQMGVHGVNNLVLVGDPDVGEGVVKSAIYRSVKGIGKFNNLGDAAFLEFNTVRFLDQLAIPGEFEENVRKLIEAIKQTKKTKKAVLLLNFQDIYRVGALKGKVMAGLNFLLKEAIDDPDISVVGVANEKVYKEYFEHDRDLSRTFGKLDLKTPADFALMRMLQDYRRRIKDLYGKDIPPDVRLLVTRETMEKAVELVKRYLPSGTLPDKVQEILDRIITEKLNRGNELAIALSAAEARVARALEVAREAAKGKDTAWTEKAGRLLGGAIEGLEKAREEKSGHEDFLKKIAESKAWEITAQDIAEKIARESGVPIHEMQKDESAKLKEFIPAMNKRVIGQEQAVEEMARSLTRRAEEMGDTRKPIGTFVFAGPTGVGKTEFARSMARHLFGSDDKMIRLDMSEYMEPHAKEKMIGSPPGYIGYDAGGYLTNAVKRNPYSVILFDEIEKAHPSVFDLLLQVIDDGRLTDNHGQTADFRNTVIIMTSNLGTKDPRIRELFNKLGAKKEENAPAAETESARKELRTAMNDARGHFRKEFIGRIPDDHWLVFEPLATAQLNTILDIKLDEVSGYLRGQKYGRLILSDDVRRKILQEGYDIEMGARPMKRALQRIVLRPLARDILTGGLAEGMDIEAVFEGGGLVFKSRERAAEGPQVIPAAQKVRGIEKNLQEALAAGKEPDMGGLRKLAGLPAEAGKQAAPSVEPVKDEDLPVDVVFEEAEDDIPTLDAINAQILKLEEEKGKAQREMRRLEGAIASADTNEKKLKLTSDITAAKIKMAALERRLDKLVERRQKGADQIAAEKEAAEAARGKIVREINNHFANLTLRAREKKLTDTQPPTAPMENMLRVLMQKRRNYPFVVSASPVTAQDTIESFAVKAAAGAAPGMERTRVLRLKLETMKQYFSLVGMLEDRLREVIDFIEEDDARKDLRTVIVVDFEEVKEQIQNIRVNPFILGFFLKLFKGKKTIQFVMTTTNDKIRDDEAFDKYFTLVETPPMTAGEALENMALFRTGEMARRHNEGKAADQMVTVAPAAVAQAVEIAAKHVPQSPVMETVVDWLNNLFSLKSGAEGAALGKLMIKKKDLRQVLQDLVDEGRGREEDADLAAHKDIVSLLKDINALEAEAAAVKGLDIGARDVVNYAKQKTDMAADELTKDDRQSVLSLGSDLRKRIVGQDEAVEAVATAVEVAKAGLKAPKAPVGSFFFSGPTGVGKTELAKNIAKTLGYELVKYDMSEYSERHQISKLIGAPPGYIGYEDTAELLTEKIRRNPKSVILFDEVDKAHPAIFDALLQILEDGRLTDSKGQTADFSQTVIILSSNVGMEARGYDPAMGQWKVYDSLYPQLKEAVLSGDEAKLESFYKVMRDQVMEETKARFRPEFLNRFDNIVVFRALGKQSLYDVLDIFLGDVKRDIYNRRGVEMVIGGDDKERKEVYDLLIERGYEPEYGMRRMEDLIQKVIVDPFIAFKNQTPLIEGDKVILRLKDGAIAFERIAAPEKEEKALEMASPLEAAQLKRLAGLLHQTGEGEEIKEADLDEAFNLLEEIKPGTGMPLEGEWLWESVVTKEAAFWAKDQAMRQFAQDTADKVPSADPQAGDKGKALSEWIAEASKLAKKANLRQVYFKNSPEKRIAGYDEMGQGELRQKLVPFAETAKQEGKQVVVRRAVSPDGDALALQIVFNTPLSRDLQRIFYERDYGTEEEIRTGLEKSLQGLALAHLALKSTGAKFNFHQEVGRRRCGSKYRL